MRIQLDAREINEALRFLPEHVVRPAAAMALNDVGRQGGTAGKQKIRDKFNLTAAFVNDRVKVSAFSKADDLTLTIQATGRPIDLTHFGARWVNGNRIVKRKGGAMDVRTLKRRAKGPGGVFYEAIKGAPGHLPNAFIATVKAGKSDTHVGVFVREGRKRLPLIKKMLISIPSMFEQEPVFLEIKAVIDAKFPERFEHHIDRYIAAMPTGPS